MSADEPVDVHPPNRPVGASAVLKEAEVPVQGTSSRPAAGHRSRWRRRRSAVTTVVLALAIGTLPAAAGYWISGLRAPVYSATAVVRLVDTVDRDFGLRGDDLTRWVSSQAQEITSPDTAAAAAEALGDGTTTTELQDAVNVTPDDALLMITVTAQGPSRVAATARADAVTSAYAVRTEARIAAAVTTASDRFQGRLQAIDNQIADASASLAADPADRYASTLLASSLDWRMQLGTSAIDAQEQARREATTLRDVQDAVVSGSPVSPRPAQDAAVTAIVAALLATGVAVQLARRRDRAVRDSDEAAALLGLPVLADVARDVLGLHPDDHDHATALGFAAATILLELGPHGGVVLVTGPSGDADAVRLVAQQVAACAEREGWWDVVTTDTRAPWQVDRQVESAPGGTTTNRSRRALRGGAPETPDAPRAKVGALRADARLVVATCPAVGRRADVAAAVMASDRVLVVIPDGTRRHAVSAAGEVLQLLRASILGVVFVRGDGSEAAIRHMAPRP